ncbi:hypothetical protein ACFCZ1_34665 [Streptomyces sp. NPDC056224]|uniref:hypothetical protein n=1 Tax=Streptomyces sp. NPDC056224 TaxID=3345750 RepID=UPI0035E0811F
MDTFEQVLVEVEEGSVDAGRAGEPRDGDVTPGLHRGIEGLEDAFAASGRVGPLPVDHGVGHPAPEPDGAVLPAGRYVGRFDAQPVGDLDLPDAPPGVLGVKDEVGLAPDAAAVPVELHAGDPVDGFAAALVADPVVALCRRQVPVVHELAEHVDRYPRFCVTLRVGLPVGVGVRKIFSRSKTISMASCWDSAAGRLSFEALQRLAAARSRTATALAAKTPVFFIAFDALQIDGIELLALPTPSAADAWRSCSRPAH